MTLQKLILLLVLDRDARCRGGWWRHWHHFLGKFPRHLFHRDNWRLLVCGFDCEDQFFFTLVESGLLIEVLLVIVVVLVVLHD